MKDLASNIIDLLVNKPSAVIDAFLLVILQH